ncbi:MAG: hypothetical protein K0S37_1880 [Microbacterium sp.]|nr:hypothetical protein [Microbacterium sp.]
MTDPGFPPGDDWLAAWSLPQRTAWAVLEGMIETIADPHFSMAQGTVSPLTAPAISMARTALTTAVGSDMPITVKDDFAEALSSGAAMAEIAPGSDTPAVIETRARALSEVLQKWLPKLLSQVTANSTPAQELTRLWMRLSGAQAAEDVQRRVSGELKDTLSAARIAVADTQELRDQVGTLVGQASAAADDAKAAAADIGSNELSKMYDTYASKHLSRAMWFRIATIALLGAGIVLAASLVLGGDFPELFGTRTPSRTSEWAPVAYRLAVVAGIAALAAYLGRQAGNHRRLGEWARAIEILLREFNAFIAKIADPKVRDEAQLAFARRVLGPAPDASRVVESASALQPVVDAFTRRSG